MTAWKRCWRAETGLFAGTWLALMVAGRTRMFSDGATMWHTATGHLMLAARRVVATEPFSFPHQGEPWVNAQWLAQGVMALAHAVAGRDGQLLLAVTALAALFAGIGRRLLHRGLDWLPTVVIVGLVLAASSTHFLVRPLIASLIGFALLYALLIDFEAGRIGPGRLWTLVPLFVAWANLHGAMLGGLATLALAVVGWGAARLVGRDSPMTRPGRALGLGLLLIACGATMFASPFGSRLPAMGWALMRSPVVPRLVQEHRALGLGDPEFWAVLVVGLVYLGALAGTRPRRVRVTWLIPLAWWVLALARVRHAPLFAIAAALALADILPHSRLAHWLARPGRDLFRFQPASPSPGADAPARRDWWPVAPAAVLVLGAALLQVGGVRVPILGRGWAGLDPTTWPVGLIPELERAGRQHAGGARVFNDYEFAGFVIEHAPNLKVVIDDRWEVYGDEELERFHHAQAEEPALIDDWLDRDAIDYVLVATGSGFDRRVASEPGWTRLGRDPVASFYGRSGPPRATPAVATLAGSDAN